MRTILGFNKYPSTETTYINLSKYYGQKIFKGILKPYIHGHNYKPKFDKIRFHA
jgi:hypothetical protein